MSKVHEGHPATKATYRHRSAHCTCAYACALPDLALAQAHLSAKPTKHEIGNRIAAVAAKSAIRTGAAYVPYVGGVVSTVGEAAIDEVSK